MKAETAMVVLQVLAVVARPQEGYSYPVPEGAGLLGSGSGGTFPSDSPIYSFQWDVSQPSDDNYYGHQEQREDDYTQGRYFVLLPDSRRLIVEYYVDTSGYHPTITYEGEAQYPAGGGQGPGYSSAGSRVVQIPSLTYLLPDQ